MRGASWAASSSLRPRKQLLSRPTGLSSRLPPQGGTRRSGCQSAFLLICLQAPPLTLSGRGKGRRAPPGFCKAGDLEGDTGQRAEQPGEKATATVADPGQEDGRPAVGVALPSPRPGSRGVPRPQPARHRAPLLLASAWLCHQPWRGH